MALIGADGIWSSVRNHLFPEVQPQFSGLIAWRGTLDATALPREYTSPRVQLWMGPNAHLVAYPISAARRINVVAIVPGTWNRPGWSAAGEANEIKNVFATSRWPSTARMLIGAVDEWRRWALFTLPEIGDWSEGSVALLGDAAHAMLPFAAQGAGMAIEDAAVLAKCLERQRGRKRCGHRGRAQALRPAAPRARQARCEQPRGCRDASITSRERRRSRATSRSGRWARAHAGAAGLDLRLAGLTPCQVSASTKARVWRRRLAPAVPP